MSSNITSNKNFLSPITFKLVIDSSQFANLEYFCTVANLPGVSLPEVELPFRGYKNQIAGDRQDFPPLDVTFIVDENMTNYIEIFNWIKQNHSNDDFLKRDIVLAVGNSSNNIVKKVRFVDAFPTLLNPIQFNAQNLDVEYLTADVSFRYTYSEFI